MKLNEDLTEVIALAHDLGHPPFGHAGERALNKLMQNVGGFEHNSQGLRTVDLLEYRPPNKGGLNLCFEVLETMAFRSKLKIRFGDIDRAGIYTGLIHDRVDVRPFKEHLLSGNFGLISLPIGYRKHLVVGEGIEV